MKLRGSTALSTIAVQSGQSQSTVSVLKSGSRVHLQLVQVHPGLCEIGSSQEENLKLIQEQQQLLEQLQKREQEVVLAVKEKTRRRRRKRRSREDEEEQEEVLQAMVSSLKEGWSLLLHLLHRRQEVLLLAADFYRQALEFSVSIGRLEDFHINSNIINEVQLHFQSMRKDVLRKSLQLLTSCNLLEEKLRELQREEEVQRRGGGVLQEEVQRRGGVLQEELQRRGGGVLQEEVQRRGGVLQEEVQRRGGVLQEEVQRRGVLQEEVQRRGGVLQEEVQRRGGGVLQEEQEEVQRRGGVLQEEVQRRGGGVLQEEQEEVQRRGGVLQEEQEEVQRRGGVLQEEQEEVQRRGGGLQEEVQRRGGVLQEEQEEVQRKGGVLQEEVQRRGGVLEEVQRGGLVLRLEQLVEELQDRRRRADQEVKLHLLQESTESGTRTTILDQDLQPGSTSDLKSEESRDLESGSGSEESRILQPGSGPEESRILQSGSRPEESRILQPGSGSGPEESRILQSGPGSEESRILQSGSRPEESRILQSGSRPEESRILQPGSRPESRILQSGSRPEESRILQSGPGPEESRILQSGSRPEESRILQSGPGPEESRILQSGPGPEESRILQSGPGPEESRILQPGPRPEESRISVSAAEKGEEPHHGEGHAHQTLPTNQRLRMMRSCDQQLEKAAILIQQSRNFKTDEILQDLKESADHMKQILDQTRTRTRTRTPSEPSRRLKALTEQLRRKTRPGAGSPSPGLPGPEDLVLKKPQSLNQKLESNLDLLDPYARFLKTVQQVEEDLEELKEVYRPRTEEEPGGSRKEVSWDQTLQNLLVCQELGTDLVRTLPDLEVSGTTRNLQEAVQQDLERLNKTKQEVSELRSRHQIQIQIQYESCRKYKERLNKVLQDLTCVSEMLDSCSKMDLGSDLQTSRLLENFSRARPHFTKLDAEVEVLVKAWGALRGVQDRLQVLDSAVTEEDLSELLKVQQRVKTKIQQSQKILDLSRSFHLTTNQLEELLQSDPLSGPAGSSGSRKDQIQDLLKTASRLRTAVCTAVAHADWTRFSLDQLDPRLRSLDRLWVSWLNEATRREEREERTRLLSDDIIQLQDSFKELKKRFSNLRFNFLKKNDRNRNNKAARNQLQQVELHQEKLQALRKRLQEVTSRLGSEVRDRGVAREMEDAVNELQRQTGELERSVNEHRRSLELSSRLQRALEEYQVWVEEAASTIARVRKFSSECRSSDSVSVLNQQLEKFVWPTVPQQEERIQQITELAVRVHGREDGRRYVEKTLSRHSNMVEAIRQLSRQLTDLDQKLKEEEEEEEDERKIEEEQQDLADMYELKETGHTPELTAKHDGKNQTSANRKSPFSQESESRQQWYSENFVPSFSLSGSPVGGVRRVHVISQSQTAVTDPQATPPPFVIGLSFSDIQREFQRKETSCGSTKTPLQNAPGGGLVQQLEVMTDDSLSNGEYDCVSPDDISLPPLAETPESITVLDLDLDLDEAYSVQAHQAEHPGTGSGSGFGSGSGTRAVRQTPSSRHSSSRFRSESSSLVQSPLTVPASSVLTSILKTGKTFTTKPPQSPEPRSSSGSHQVHQSKSKNIPETRSPSHHQPQSSGPQGNVAFNGPDPGLDQNKDRTTICQVQLVPDPNRVHQDRESSRTRMETVKPDGDTQTSEGPSSQRETWPQVDLVHQHQSLVDLHQDKTQDPELLKSFQTTTSDLDQDAPGPGTVSVLVVQSSSPTTTDQTGSCTSAPPPEPQTPIHPTSSKQDPQRVHQTSSSEDPLSQDKTQDPELLKSFQTTITLPQDLDQDAPGPGTVSVLVVQRRSPTTADQTGSSTSNRTSGPPPEPQDPIHPSSGKQDPQRVHQTSTSEDPSSQDKTQDPELLKSFQTTVTLHQDLNQDAPGPGTVSVLVVQRRSPTTADQTGSSPSNRTSGPPPEPQDPIHPTSSKQDLQRVHQTSSSEDPSSQDKTQDPELLKSFQTSTTLHQIRLTSLKSWSDPDRDKPVLVVQSSGPTTANQTGSCWSCTSGPPPEPQTPTHPTSSNQDPQTSTQQCVHDLGMTSSSSAPRAAPPQPQALANLHVAPPTSPPHLLTPDQDPDLCRPVSFREEIRITPQVLGPPLPAPPPPSPPQGPQPGPPFTRPWSRATVMEGSLVTLEMEVKTHPEPELSRCNHGDGVVGGHFLSDGGDDACHFLSDGDDDAWLVEEVCDIISEDWTWWGSLWVLLVLVYLVLL